MKVPCCKKCNNEDFAGVEERLKGAFLQGFEEFRELNPTDLFLWLGKIYYGIVYHESLLPLELSQQDGQRLISDVHLQTLAFHRYLLGAASGRVRWDSVTSSPASFHFFRCLDHPQI